MIKTITKTKSIIRPTEAAMTIRGKSSINIAFDVYENLKSGYDKKLLGWILTAHWFGPIEVPMEIIDSTNSGTWDAIKRAKKIRKMCLKMQEGINKPIILVNDPDNPKLKLIDGHTRFLARASISGTTIQAYIAEVGPVRGDWKEMCKLLKDGESGGNR
jgi:hypothetical protein